MDWLISLLLVGLGAAALVFLGPDIQAALREASVKDVLIFIAVPVYWMAVRK